MALKEKLQNFWKFTGHFQQVQNPVWEEYGRSNGFFEKLFFFYKVLERGKSHPQKFTSMLGEYALFILLLGWLSIPTTVSVQVTGMVVVICLILVLGFCDIYFGVTRKENSFNARFSPENQVLFKQVEDLHRKFFSEQKKEEEKEPALPDAERTMIGVIAEYKPDKSVANGVPFVTDNTNIRIKRSGTMLELAMAVDLRVLKEKISSLKTEFLKVRIDCTNDPTNDLAGTPHSLGYICIRHSLEKCKIVSLFPFTVRCLCKDHSESITRPQRPVSESDEQVMFEKLKVPLSEFVLGNIKKIGEVGKNGKEAV